MEDGENTKEVRSKIPEDAIPETEVDDTSEDDVVAETSTSAGTDFVPVYGIEIVASADFEKMAVRVKDGLKAGGDIPLILIEQMLDRIKQNQMSDIVTQAISSLTIPMQMPDGSMKDIPYPSVIANQVTAMLMQAQQRVMQDQQIINKMKNGIIRP